MEWILLLILSSLASGAVAYFLKDDKKDTIIPTQEQSKEKEEVLQENKGARSSPQFPEVKQKVRFTINQEDLDKFKDFVKKMPSPIQPDVRETDDLKKTLQEVKQEIHKRKKPLKVTYSTDEIIPRTSPFSRHRRPLQNAEKFVEEQKAKEALSIYERLLKRIPDEEIKQKIQTNIDDIKRWLMGLDEEETIEFPEIIIPLSTQTVAIEKFNEGLKNISEDIAKEISKVLSDSLKDIKATLNISDANIQSKQIRSKEITIESREDFREGKAPFKDIDTKEETGPVESSKREEKQELKTPSGSIPSIEQKSHFYYIIPSFVRKVPKTLQKQKGIPELTLTEIPTPIGPKVPTRPEEYFESIVSKEGFQFDSEGNLITDGWTDRDFEREWEKYKQLPLIDRRTGKDRRKDFHYDPDKPDRRTGEDRRKINLFEERDKFLEKYQKHLERKKLLEEQKEIFSSYIPTTEKKDIILPYITPIEYEEEFEEIQLPDPISEKFEDLQESIKTLEIDVEPIEHQDKTKEDSSKRIEPYKKEDSIESEKETQIELEELNLPEAEKIYEEPYTLELPETESIEEPEFIFPKEKEISYSKVELIEPPLENLNLPEPEEKSFKDEFPEEYEEEKEDTTTKNQKEQEQDQKPEISSEAKQEQLGEGVEEIDFPEMPEKPETKGPVQEIRGVLELRPPDEDDAPFLTLTYDFSKIPDSFQLSKNYHTLEYAYYKYKPLLIKAQEFARRKMLKNALNYYRMIKSQNIPPEFKRMINRNIQDITDYIEKFMMSRSND
jgi:hypothetical protein